MANAAIAGPRRAKQAPPPTQAVAAAPVAQTRPARQLQADDEPTRSASRRPVPAQVITMPVKRGKSHRLRWFILGVAFGAVGAVLARGEAVQTLHDIRVWSARALRSLERTAPPPPAKLKPTVAAPPAKPLSAASEPPCPMNPAPGDPCAELLAPFLDPPKAPVPVVSIDALPRAKPPVLARRHRHVTPAPAPVPAATAADDAEDPPSDDEQPISQVTTAENDPPPIQ